jgi:hypothetical protein
MKYVHLVEEKKVWKNGKFMKHEGKQTNKKI